MRQRTLVLEDLTEIAAIHPAPTGWAGDEMLGLVLRRLAKRPTEVFAARDHLDQSSSASRFTADASGFLNLSQSGERPER
jgi:hypothetical protein